MKKKLTFTKDHTHRGRDYRPGEHEEFEANVAARIIACGSAHEFGKPPKAPDEGQGTAAPAASS
ncbi:MAG: hypothetical protein ABF296_09435 [Oceanococcaceae bacterium]